MYTIAIEKPITGSDTSFTKGTAVYFDKEDWKDASITVEWLKLAAENEGVDGVRPHGTVDDKGAEVIGTSHFELTFNGTRAAEES